MHNHEPQSVKVTTAARLLDSSRTQVFELIRYDFLKSHMMGGCRMVTMASINHVIKHGYDLQAARRAAAEQQVVAA